jgi:hypothetical protein
VIFIDHLPRNTPLFMALLSKGVTGFLTLIPASALTSGQQVPNNKQSGVPKKSARKKLARASLPRANWHRLDLLTLGYAPGDCFSLIGELLT